MKQLMSKNIIFLLLLFSFTLFTILPTEVHAEDTNVYECSLETNALANMEDSFSPYADIIEWRYTTINGIKYRRKYNYSKGIWIGDWEVAP